jgi:hypothetical protein
MTQIGYGVEKLHGVLSLAVTVYATPAMAAVGLVRLNWPRQHSILCICNPFGISTIARPVTLHVCVPHSSLPTEFVYFCCHCD